MEQDSKDFSRFNEMEHNNSAVESRRQRMANLEIVLQHLPITGKNKESFKAISCSSDKLSKQKRLRQLRR